MTMTISGTSGITFPSTAVQSDAAIGYGQTWQNVTASRAFSTTYTNSTGKSILVSVYTYTSGPNYTQISINGVLSQLSCGGNVNYAAAVCTVIPVGATYQVVSNSSLQTWYEFR